MLPRRERRALRDQVAPRCFEDQHWQQHQRSDIPLDLEMRRHEPEAEQQERGDGARLVISRSSRAAQCDRAGKGEQEGDALRGLGQEVVGDSPVDRRKCIDRDGEESERGIPAPPDHGEEHDQRDCQQYLLPVRQRNPGCDHFVWSGRRVPETQPAGEQVERSEADAAEGDQAEVVTPAAVPDGIVRSGSKGNVPEDTRR